MSSSHFSFLGSESIEYCFWCFLYVMNGQEGVCPHHLLVRGELSPAIHRRCSLTLLTELHPPFLEALKQAMEVLKKTPGVSITAPCILIHDVEFPSNTSRSTLNLTSSSSSSSSDFTMPLPSKSIYGNLLPEKKKKNKKKEEDKPIKEVKGMFSKKGVLRDTAEYDPVRGWSSFPYHLYRDLPFRPNTFKNCPFEPIKPKKPEDQDIAFLTTGGKDLKEILYPYCPNHDGYKVWNYLGGTCLDYDPDQPRDTLEAICLMCKVKADKEVKEAKKKHQTNTKSEAFLDFIKTERGLRNATGSSPRNSTTTLYNIEKLKKARAAAVAAYKGDQQQQPITIDDDETEEKITPKKRGRPPKLKQLLDAVSASEAEAEPDVILESEQEPEPEPEPEPSPQKRTRLTTTTTTKEPKFITAKERDRKQTLAQNLKRNAETESSETSPPTKKTA